MLTPVAPYCERDGLEQMKVEIEAEDEGITVTTKVRWQKPWALIARHQPPATDLFSVRDKKQAKKLLEGGVGISGRKQTAHVFIPEGLDIQCAKCYEWGHSEHRCGRKRPWCRLCAGDRRTTEHKCPAVEYAQGGGGQEVHACHSQVQCVRTDGHPSRSFRLPVQKGGKSVSQGTPSQPGNPTRERIGPPTAHAEMLVLQHNYANGGQVVEAAL